MNHSGNANKMVETPRTDAAEKHAYQFKDEWTPVCESKLVRQLERELNAANQRIKRLEHCAEIAWGIIANVDSGSWQEQRADWLEAATRWRDEQFYPELSERKAKEAKP